LLYQLSYGTISDGKYTAFIFFVQYLKFTL